MLKCELEKENEALKLLVKKLQLENANLRKKYEEELGIEQWNVDLNEKEN